MDTNETKIYITLLIGVAIQGILMIFFLVTIFRYQRKKTALHVQKFKEDFNFLDKEKQRISLELHDDLGASLSAIKLRLQLLSQLDSAAMKIVDNCELLLDEVMQKLRRTSLKMMPGILKRKGLDAALKDLLGMMTFGTGIETHYYCEPIRFKEDTAIHIYRIVQEALNNLIKHSKATSLDVAINKTKNVIRILIHDNGIGFDNKHLQKSSGLGLHTIKARAELLNATVCVTTSENEGVEYLIEIPAYHEQNKSDYC
jgi:signal transduction histidine kinase